MNRTLKTFINRSFFFTLAFLPSLAMSIESDAQLKASSTTPNSGTTVIQPGVNQNQPAATPSNSNGNASQNAGQNTDNTPPAYAQGAWGYNAPTTYNDHNAWNHNQPAYGHNDWDHCPQHAHYGQPYWDNNHPAYGQGDWSGDHHDQYGQYEWNDQQMAYNQEGWAGGQNFSQGQQPQYGYGHPAEGQDFDGDGVVDPWSHQQYSSGSYYFYPSHEFSNHGHGYYGHQDVDHGDRQWEGNYDYSSGHHGSGNYSYSSPNYPVHSNRPYTYPGRNSHYNRYYQGKNAY